VRLLLFSGGVESTCLAHELQPDLLLTIDYGQKPVLGETRAATTIASRLSLRHELISVPMQEMGRGDMAGSHPARDEAIPEWWPYRNQMLITLAAMRYEREGLQEIIIGTMKTDSVHSDGTQQFITNIDVLMRCQAPYVTVVAPAINMTTLELVGRSRTPRELLGWTHSCHRSSIACGVCRGCYKTIQLFKELDEEGKI